MLRARGLIALLEVSKLQVSQPLPTLLGAAGCQPAAWWSGAAPAAPYACFAARNDLQAHVGGDRLQEIASKGSCAGLTTSAATAAASSGAHQPQSNVPAGKLSTAGAEPAKLVLYRGKGMQLFRLLVRMKVFQLAGIAALAVPINTFLSTGSLATTQAVITSALVVGAGVASTALWYYSRRYVGELALLQGPPEAPRRVRISVLDFWGNREDNDVLLDRFIPPLAQLPEGAARAALGEPLLPVDVEGDRQYFLSVRYGRVVDPTTLYALLRGQLEGRQPGADGGSSGGGSNSSSSSSSSGECS